MKQKEQEGVKYYTAAQLVGLPGLPGSLRGVMNKIQREAWPHRRRAPRAGDAATSPARLSS